MLQRGGVNGRERSSMQRLDHVVWHGTLIEQLDLIAAVQHNCECRYDTMGQSRTACVSHVMLASDQRALNGLLWNRCLAQRLLIGEGIAPRRPCGLMSFWRVQRNDRSCA
jgi:hypothetical protein